MITYVMWYMINDILHIDWYVPHCPDILPALLAAGVFRGALIFKYLHLIQKL